MAPRTVQSYYAICEATMSSHNLPNLKRLWYCDHLHQKTGGCVCRTHPDQSPKCETIRNTSIQQIDQIRAEKRRTRLPRPRFLFGLSRQATRY